MEKAIRGRGGSPECFESAVPPDGPRAPHTISSRAPQAARPPVLLTSGNRGETEGVGLTCVRLRRPQSSPASAPGSATASGATPFEPQSLRSLTLNGGSVPLHEILSDTIGYRM